MLVTALTMYTIQLLIMCAPDSIRPFAAHNAQAVNSSNIHNVILPNMHEVEIDIRQRMNQLCAACLKDAHRRDDSQSDDADSDRDLCSTPSSAFCTL